MHSLKPPTVSAAARHIGVLSLAFAAGAVLAADAVPQPVNDLPNPYRTIRNWVHPPGDTPWAAVTAAEVGPDGSVYVIHRCQANSCIGRSEPPILKFDRSGKLLKAWGANMFVFPHGATIDAQGNLWVTDLWAKDGKGSQVFKFSPDGKLLMTLGKAGVVSSVPGTFDEPADVAVAANGDVFVVEGHSSGSAGNHRVSRFDAAGKFLASWAGKGSAHGQLFEPHTIALDSQGRVFIGDRGNNRIEIYSQDGKYLQTMLNWGRPSGIYIGKDDAMYVADSESYGPDQPGWKKGIRIGSARTGEVRFLIEDMESTTIEHSGAEAIGVDADGNVYGAVVRRRDLEKHVPAAKSAATALTRDVRK